MAAAAGCLPAAAPNGPAPGALAAVEAPFDSTPIESDDGSVALALMSTSHPEIKQFSEGLSKHVGEMNALIGACAQHISAGRCPDGVVDKHLQVQATLQAIGKSVEALDSLDLSELPPEWGHKATVRMARKTLIRFTEKIVARLDGLQARLAGPASAEKERQRAARERELAERPPKPEEDLSFQDKYRHVLTKARAEAQGGDEPPAKRSRSDGEDPKADRAELDAAILRLRGKAGKPPQRLPLKALCRQLVNFSVALSRGQSLGPSPGLLCDSTACAADALAVALDEGPSWKVLGSMLALALRIDGKASTEELSSALSDLAAVLKSLSG